MDFDRRSYLVRRIVYGKLRTSIQINYQDYPVIFKDPHGPLLYEAHGYYCEMLKRAQNNGFPSKTETVDILRQKGLWTDKDAMELKSAKDMMPKLKEEIPKLRYKIAAQRNIKAEIKRLQDIIDDLEKKMGQLYHTSAEHFAEAQKRRFILKNISVFPDNPEIKLIPSVVEKLAVCYYNHNFISEAEIRELARSDPWRMYWVVAKDLGNELMSGTISDITDFQYLLFFWTKIYDFAYNSTEPPGDEVINDDIQFDAWYDAECKKHKQERESYPSSSGSNSYGIQEVGIPADREGAKEVYNLNSVDSRVRVARREKLLKEKQSARDVELPDVRQDLQMAINRSANQAVIQRS